MAWNAIKISLAVKQKDLQDRALSLADNAAAAPDELLIPACMVCQLVSHARLDTHKQTCLRSKDACVGCATHNNDFEQNEREADTDSLTNREMYVWRFDNQTQSDTLMAQEHGCGCSWRAQTSSATADDQRLCCEL